LWKQEVTLKLGLRRDAISMGFGTNETVEEKAMKITRRGEEKLDKGLGSKSVRRSAEQSQTGEEKP
jgi:hypothetical protein